MSWISFTFCFILIDEVVYHNKAQLMTAVSIWQKFKNMYMIEAKLAPHYREEGVILEEYQVRTKTYLIFPKK